jgi:hypothetical protein
MTASVPYASPRLPVRMPFRVLAGFIGIASVVAAVATLFLAWRGARNVPLGDVLMLPLTAWFLRLMFHAAVRGTTPEDGEYWPLASRGVWNCYVLLLLSYSIFKA